ncbi:MAG: hypothetical protein KR126chlam5_01229, partial [Candidatus Anoxychlamydiales bacterium]|nr:hypothetical protein [Candidatus Anoxychlamydiales bacterium]
MFLFILNVFLVASGISPQIQEIEIQNINETLLLENQYPPVSRQVDYDDLKKNMENSFTDNEK